MGRPLRATPAGLVYHVLNRASGRATLFEDADDFALFERALEDAHGRTPVRVLACCVMPTTSTSCSGRGGTARSRASSAASPCSTPGATTPAAGAPAPDTSTGAGSGRSC